MNDARLKSVYRRLTADSTRDAVSASDVVEPLMRSGYPDEEGTALDRVLASGAHADVMRTVLALDADARELSRELAALRAPVRSSRRTRGWLALAAGVGSAAILIAGLRSGPQPAPMLPEQLSEHAILSVSFESPASSTSQQQPSEPAPIFSGGFDS